MSTITIGNSTANAYSQSADTTGNLVFSTTGGIIDSSALTGSVSIPSGNINARPTGVNGTIRYNTSNASLEVYISGEWKNFP